MNMSLFAESANFWTPIYGIHRWGSLCEKAGTYRLVWKYDFLDFVKEHKSCVVDDFGDLVVVPA